MPVFGFSRSAVERLCREWLSIRHHGLTVCRIGDLRPGTASENATWCASAAHDLPRAWAEVGTRKFKVQRRQFPVQPVLEQAMHRAQRQSVGRLPLIATNFFQHGRLYVALSRVKARPGVLMLVSPECIQGEPSRHRRGEVAAPPIARLPNIIHRRLL